ncbi:YifB family Mg chelatase-like AAA ATPase [Candidatus Uhrbacteria bacterium]|nr:YifB family Mg chelatase-like AAA ATPase [Candidatus Uhrbacteria bacterium]
MFSITSSAIFGTTAIPVSVEVDIASGLPQFTIVGLPDASVRESRDRIKAAIKNSGFQFPRGHVTVNLAPAHLRKQGACYDLPIAMAILCRSGQLDENALVSSVLLGELGLHGEIRTQRGVLATTLMAKQNGHLRIFVPKNNAAEAALVEGIGIFGIETIQELVAHMRGDQPIIQQPPTQPNTSQEDRVDFAMIRGQESAKRALEIAASGGHHLLLSGPPGTGKTLLARSIAGILPTLTREEMLEVTSIASIAGIGLNPGVLLQRPLRSPHHSASAAALVGGGSLPRPGEITLSHRGVLFLDELPEFSSRVLEHLRQPLEEGEVVIARAHETVRFPAQFQLIATMNPCPCGYFNDPKRACTCAFGEVDRYRKKISGPLLDRIDLFASVPNLQVSDLETSVSETSACVQRRVQTARERQQDRYKIIGIKTNAQLSQKNLDAYCSLNKQLTQLLHACFARGMLSMRGYTRIKKIARTIADLAGAEQIEKAHLIEALQYKERL